MFKQNIKRKEINKNQLIRYRRKKKQSKTEKTLWSVLSCWKEWFVHREEKNAKSKYTYEIHRITKYTELQNTRIYTIGSG